MIKPSPASGEGPARLSAGAQAGRLAGGRVMALINAAHKIANSLYKSNPARYKPLFEFVNSSAKQRKPAHVIFDSVKQLAERERNKKPVSDVRQYLGGTLRKLEIEAETKRLRSGRRDPTAIGEINFTLKSLSRSK